MAEVLASQLDGPPVKRPIFSGNPRKHHARVPPLLVEPDSVFLNIPYDQRFSRLYRAYIVGLVELGLTPKATLGIPGGRNQLERIFDLIQTCRYSLHDLSRVELDRTPPPTPRFNMPLELGLAIAWEKLHAGRHTWFVYETVNRRAQKSISDLNGVDFNIHDGSPEGVMRELRNCFVRRKQSPDLPRMLHTYGKLNRLVPALLQQTGAKTLFEASIFDALITMSARLRGNEAAIGSAAG